MFESSVNSDSIQTNKRFVSEGKLFESSVNSDSIQTYQPFHQHYQSLRVV